VLILCASGLRKGVALSQNFHEGQKFDAKFGGF
jgi:hypothetical protein